MIFTTKSDPRRNFIWRGRGSQYQSSYIKEIDKFVGKEIKVLGDIMLSNCTLLHVFDVGTVNAYRYMDEILEGHVRLCRISVDTDFVLWTIVRRHSEFTLLMIILRRGYLPYELTLEVSGSQYS